MAKKFMEFMALVMTVVLVTTFTVTPALALPREQITFVLIGGDGDSPGNFNNLFSQTSMGDHLDDLCTTRFVESISGDYSNSTAQQQARLAERYLSNATGYRFLAAYSHGGQSAYFVNLENVNEIFLLDACAKIQGICNNPATCGDVWSKWVISAAASGVTVHIFATDGKRDISRASVNAVNLIYRYSNSGYHKKGISIINVGNGNYQVLVNGMSAGNIEAVCIGGDHGQACINSANYVFDAIHRF